MPGFRTIVLALSLAVAAQAGTGAPDAPAYWPTCGAIQQSAPTTLLNNDTVASFSALPMVWDGSRFLVAYIESYSLTFRIQPVFADGTPDGSPVVIAANAHSNYEYSLKRLPAGLIAHWFDMSAGQYRVAILSKSLTILWNGIVSNVGSSGTPEAVSDLSVGATKSIFAWLQFDAISVQYKIRTTFVDHAGGISGGGTDHDVVRVSSSQNIPAMRTKYTGENWGIYYQWYDGGNSRYNIGFTYSGGFLSALITTGIAGRDAHLHSIAPTPEGALIAWIDERDLTSGEVYVALLDGGGYLATTPQRLTSNALSEDRIIAQWTGAEFGVAWSYVSISPNPLEFRRVSADAAPLGSTLTLKTIYQYNFRKGAAFGDRGWLFLTNSGGLLASPFACAADSSPPTCAGGYVGYSISGTTATLGWLPSDDPQSDIAYYNVYRNAALVGRTAANYYNDSGLSPSTSYAYAVQPVNAWQLRNSACTDTLYLNTNASLTLTVDKGAPAALLNWSDVGAPGYRIYRGTTPREMTQIGQSSGQSLADGAALSTPASYFYSVDE